MGLLQPQGVHHLWHQLSLTMGLPGLHRYRNTMDAFVNIARAEGFNGLFRGLIPTILTNAPASGGLRQSTNP